MQRIPALFVVIAVALLSCGLPAFADTTTVYNTDQLRNALNAADAGDRILMAGPDAGGSFTARLWVTDRHGTAENMIQVVPLDPTDRPVFTSDGTACFTLSNCSYILVEGVIAEHGGTVAQDCNNIEFPNSNHMIVKNCISREIDNQDNSDAYKFASSDNILMYNCVAENWAQGGSGVDIMNNHNSLFMRNYITYPTLPVYAGANGFQPKSNNAYQSGFYKNTFEDGSSRAQQFGGAGGSSGWEAYQMVAMGSTMHLGEAAVAYVSCTTSTFAYNTIVRPELYVMRILKEGIWGAADNTFERNLIEYGNVTVQNIGAGNDAASFTYKENYWYKYTNPGASIPTLAAPEINPAGGTDPQLDADYRPLYDGAKDYGAHAPAMEAAFEDYASWFQWAWDWAQVFEPKAAPGGPYEVGPGGTVTFDASASYAGVGSYGAYSFDSLQWDLDRDGSYDETGQTVQVSYDELTALGLGFGSHLVELKATVTNEYNTLWDLGWAELVLVNHPALAGDANADNVVDGLDYNAWSLHYLESGHPAWADGGWSVGNFNADDIVDGLDYNVWSLNYAPEGGAAAVPEPAMLGLLAAGVLLLKRRFGRS